MQVRAHAKLVAIDGRKLTFQIEAWDEMEKVGQALDERFVIDTEKFTARAEAKKSQGK